MDVVIACDLRFPGGTSTSVVEEIRAGAAAGYRIGVAHLDSSTLKTDRPIHPLILAEFEAGRARLLLPGQTAHARLLVVKHPTVFTRPLGGRLPITADEVVLVVGQVPLDNDGTLHYEPAAVDAHLVAAVGRRATWAPVSPVVRSRLQHAADAAQILLAPDDWVEIIDPAPWRVERTSPVDPERMVLGRHSRPSRLKWPADPAELLAAYPDDASVRVRVMGGIDGVADVLGREPQHWEVLPFGAMPAREFLSGIDVFVYFHHPALVEAFGRTILEALAAGAVVVLPPHFEAIFGPAARYAEPAGVPALVDELHRDAEARTRQIRLGLDELERRFSHRAHAARLAELIGPPDPAAPAPLPPPDAQLIPPHQRDQLPTVMVVAFGVSHRRLRRAIKALAAQRARTGGFVPVVVTTSRPPRMAHALGVQVETIQNRWDWDGAPDQWPEYAARRLRVIARRHRATTVTPLDLEHPDAWIALRARPPGPPA
ncbi:MAG TPA: hypothetical protein VIS05_02340 [Ilumatobacter sp.]